ncbi:signal transduction histidine kinase [Paenibacillus cellulosilyticus]|uniref:histidine kinase n=1 Tax=Paenibacillus cellulosilyticus TaxID=375489 RepID=A0A2V2YTZ2_9BACL|nr:HAMP domain-containing sensor histidine kinase [Paenibacillus cellulosilyticus]PWW03151.1 signal transduction histidine kinase [Paenibacillus cellulosilyticus]QKS43649.1 HAMP domain-containing histidine kinase [Paenibacillus cellulosilyticus]
MKRLWNWLSDARRSLVSRYVILMSVAVILIPLALILVVTILFLIYPPYEKEHAIYGGAIELENKWHNEAKALGGKSEEAIQKRLEELYKRYSKATIYWVDPAGDTRLQLPKDAKIQQHWTAADAMQFMKERRSGGDELFTIVAFIGDQPSSGFIILEVPRSIITPTFKNTTFAKYWSYAFPALLLIILFLFIGASWLFFYRISRRLLHMQKAMTSSAAAFPGIPGRITVGKQDEIGRLEFAFNTMIEQLEHGRLRETEEEQLRRQLIANLSHDLRTPLTAIRGHAFQLNEEPLSSRGRESLQVIDRKVDFLSRLIDNLLSYTLLSAGRYPYRPEVIDMNRLLRQLCANWYAAFEQQGIELELDAPDHGFRWEIDPQWMERIADNLFQNILRHARDGGYALVRLYVRNGSGYISFVDQGPGMDSESGERGSGIGLSIVSLMAKEMGLQLTIDSSTAGTRITLQGLNQI